MSKELEKVNEIRNKAIYKADGTTVIQSEYFNLLVAYAKESLQRLESIDSVKPSKALEAFDRLTDALSFYEDFISDLPFCVDFEVDWNDVSIVREALEQSKEKE